MGRGRDRITKEDFSSDSDYSEQEEAEPYGEFGSFNQGPRRKRRRFNRGKEDAILGVFGEDFDDDDRDLMRKTMRYTEVNFVEQEEEDETAKDQDMEARPTEKKEKSLNLGSSNAPKRSWSGVTDFDGNRHGGLGFKPQRNDSTPQAIDSIDMSEDDDNYKPSFAAGFQMNNLNGRPSFSQHTTTQFNTMDTALPAPPKSSASFPTKRSSTATRKYGMGASMLEKMGYQQGQGLGSEGQGMLNPIDTKLRPERMGLGGVKEMTAQAKEEARRRGQVVSDDEDKPRRGKKSGSSTPSARTKAKKVVYQTAEQMAGGLTVPATIQKLFDLQGNEISLSSAVGGKMEDERRIAQLAMRDLKRFGDEFKALQEQKKYLNLESSRLTDEIAQEDEVVRVTTEVIVVLEGITSRFTGQGMEGLYSISEEVLKLQPYVGEPGANALGIDEALIALISPAIKQLLVDWNPLKDPTADGLTLLLKPWNSILHIQSKNQMEEFVRAESGLFHRQTKSMTLKSKLISRATPYESLVYHIILPKLRSVINNEWSPYDPQPVIDLLDAWELLLPTFIHNTLLQQIIFPKLRHAIDHWNPRRSRDNVHLWIFPWLPYLGNHMDDLVKTVQHKFKTVLEMWNISSGVIDGLEEWRDLFGKGVLENLLLKSIFPKLALELRENFVIDPSDQKLDVLMDKVMPWNTYFRASTWGQLLESEFFSKWLEMLHLWLTSEGANLEEVGQWYEWWKHQVFPSKILELDKVRKGFNEGLQLMSKAADYIERGLPLSGLPRPSTTGPQRPVEQPIRPPKTSHAPKPPVQQLKETTFRDLLEDLCAENNFVLLPLREMEKNSGKALFRITANADAKGGVLGYIGEGDVLWLQKSRQGPYEPVSMEKMVEMIEKR